MSDTESPPQAEDSLAAMVASSVGTLIERMEIELLETSPQRVVARMPVAGNTQPHGLLHGGASAVLAETLGTIGAVLHAGPGRIAVGVELNVTHHRAVRSGFVTGVATPVHRGSTITTYAVVISDEADRRVATARLTCLLRSTPPGRAAS
jgi:1,4-dihydroxy-2-naphthoyl-CoA hydrolase